MQTLEDAKFNYEEYFFPHQWPEYVWKNYKEEFAAESKIDMNDFRDEDDFHYKYAEKNLAKFVNNDLYLEILDNLWAIELENNAEFHDVAK